MLSTTTTTVTEECAQSHAIPESLVNKLDPEWVKLWNDHGRYQQRADEVSIEEYRKDPAAYSFTYPTWPGPDVHDVQDVQVPVTKPEGRIPVRVYTPKGHGPFPVHFNMHGGGWVLGGLKSEAAWCRSVCDRVGIKVVDIDYRMAPEFVFPAAIHDCWDTVKCFRANAAKFNIMPASISIGGLSAGGHMTAVMSHMARDEGVDLKLALMVVPSTDLRWSIASEPLRSEVASRYPSISLVENNPWGPRGRMSWFMDYWVPEQLGVRQAAVNDWMASPMLAENFTSLARTHIVTAEYDLSRDESHVYGDKLREHGNEVTMKCYQGMPHAFGHYNHPERGMRKSREYVDDTCEMIRSAHGL
ncbi:hypothetical protein LTR62_005476 [Meristemomyces frigidus]|uniref:Alpha/beta hydrolase fold-3 domain-containing protein n=1 Tax=Meristemomyces frigidus TaxID=1508187 RepID=A0AAN7YFE0_9PEZI|nr:hypothetical protein LTR62_005476 [Meristemomyces frigidus]